MQGLRKSLIECLRTAALRVYSGTPAPSGLLHDAAACARAAEPQAAYARWNSSATTAAASSSSSGAPRRPSSLTAHQAQKAALRPQNSGRNAFRRAWAKRLQIKWNAQERKANQALARQREHEKRLELFKLRIQWAAEAREQAA